MNKKKVRMAAFILIIILVVVIISFLYSSFSRIKSGSQGEIISGCSYLSNTTSDKIMDLLSEGNTVILREGEKVHYKDYLVIGGGRLLELAEIENNSVVGYSDNSIILEDVFSGFSFEVMFSSPSAGEILIDGVSYDVTMDCRSELEDCTMRMDFPQTSGNDLLSFENCICNSVNSQCVANMLGNSEPVKIELGLSQRNGHLINVTNGHLECEDIGKCLFGFGGIVYPENDFFNYDNMVLISCNSVLSLDEMKTHSDWIDGSRIIVQYMCLDKKFL